MIEGERYFDNAFHLQAFELSSIFKQRDNAVFRALAGAKDSYVSFHDSSKDAADWSRDVAPDGADLIVSPSRTGTGRPTDS